MADPLSSKWVKSFVDGPLVIVNLTQIDSNWILTQGEILAISPAEFFDLQKEKGQMSKSRFNEKSF